MASILKIINHGYLYMVNSFHFFKSYKINTVSINLRNSLLSIDGLNFNETKFKIDHIPIKGETDQA